MKKAIVTGVAGFIGSHIAERLIEMGVEVIGLDDLSAGHERNIPDIKKFINIDICDVEHVVHHFYGADVVFHNAASKKNICLKDPARDLRVNGYGTLKIAKLCSMCGAKMVHASTGSVYGNYYDQTMIEWGGNYPVSYYGVSKLAGEKYIQMLDLDWTILRYFHVYGPRQEVDPLIGGVVAIFRDRISRGESITIHGDGSQVRCFTHVSDVVEANIRAATYPISRSQIYNVVSDVRLTVSDLAGRLMDVYGKVPIGYEESLPGDVKNIVVDNMKVKNDLGMEFMDFTVY